MYQRHHPPTLSSSKILYLCLFPLHAYTAKPTDKRIKVLRNRNTESQGNCKSWKRSLLLWFTENGVLCYSLFVQEQYFEVISLSEKALVIRHELYGGQSLRVRKLCHSL